ncbi:MAG: class A beta-lactamase-related serine hydrolase [Hungatella sp.]|jgi:beta-lactamase class A|nr:class A beta-lactamase-related serine hydrolase [Hungatella sp.]
MKDQIIRKLEQLPGKISFLYENLKTGDGFAYHGQEPMMAASVIKLFIMAAAFEKRKKGTFQMEELFAVKREDCVPSCGALTYLHDGILVTGMDLVTLMIIFSDNTATNVLIDILGMDEINETIRGLGFRQTLLQRKMYDMENSARGIQNYITACETGGLLKMMYDGTLIDKQSSETMILILKNQQLCSKIPFYLQALSDSPEIAHKTGEDTGITHDVGIVYGKEPFLVCFCGNETDTPAFERVMAEVSLELYKQVNHDI